MEGGGVLSGEREKGKERPGSALGQTKKKKKKNGVVEKTLPHSVALARSQAGPSPARIGQVRCACCSKKSFEYTDAHAGTGKGAKSRAEATERGTHVMGHDSSLEFFLPLSLSLSTTLARRSLDD